MIKIYVYQKSDGRLIYESVGAAGFTMYDIKPDHDFTLDPPPDFSKTWYWVGTEWQAEPKQTP